MYSLGLVGYPLQHSLSPRLHQAALQASGLEGDYQLYPITPLPDGKASLETLLARLRQGEIHGLNVTIPHKQSVLPYLDSLSLPARSIGAANTLFLKDGLLVGENTDAAGFYADLRRIVLPSHTAESPGQAGHALVLGAGGSARAVIYALLSAGWHITIAARRLEQAHILADHMPRSTEVERSRLSVKPFSEISALSSPIHLLVNTTPVGMWPEVAASPWPEGLALPHGALVYDLVYNPAQTALVRLARAAGLTAVNGIGMLVEQAALAFEVWTGQAAPRQAMWGAVKEFVMEV